MVGAEFCVGEKQKQRRSYLALFHASPPQKKQTIPDKQQRTKTPHVSTRFRFCKKHRSSFPELKAMALWGFPAHPALLAVPPESTGPRQAGTGNESSRSRRLLRAFPIPPTFYTGGGVSAQPRTAVAEPTLGPAQAPHGPCPATGALPGAPGPSPAPRSAASPRWRAGPPRHPRTTWRHRSPPGRSCPSAGPGRCRGRCRARGWSPRAGARRPRRRRAGAAGPGSGPAQPGSGRRGPAGPALPELGGGIAARLEAKPAQSDTCRASCRQDLFCALDRRAAAAHQRVDRASLSRCFPFPCATSLSSGVFP